ncbi:hypothetical protein [Bacillus wiedmannii]|uniref:hypothetical protein n=1 Tax=Bacillus wiedmannii TaxID=1890302 RepID=UPI000BF123F0|nr:hypothetical protein [Bacillus wiedmannii]PEJ40070.1 hypothetical protein CN889_18145 [Bacillus wiedmannii]
MFKVCTRCNRELPVDTLYFHKKKECKYGLDSICKECRGYPFGKHKLTHEKFVDFIKETVGGEYYVLGEYKTGKQKVLMKHNTCGHKFEMQPNNFKQGQRCPECANESRRTKRRMSHSEFVERVKTEANSEYTVVGKYVNANTKVLMRHNECGYEWGITPDKFRVGQRCPNCIGKCQTHETFVEWVETHTNNEYMVFFKPLIKNFL